jgi:DNA-binding transcriptional regulator YhcF (GntR family)
VDLQINSKSHVPVHVQLKGQLVHLILTGRLKVGSRLPSIRAMAGFLRINRNTVARVFSDLERDGFVESRRGSGVYVVEPPVAEEDLKRQRLLERVMELAAAQGMPVEDLGYALLARAGVPSPEKSRVLFVECTQPELDQYAAELEEQLPVEVDRVLVEDLEERLAERGGEPPWRLVVTTFFHVHEVQELAEPRGLETVALLAQANLESLQRLTELPAGTPVGVLGYSQTCLDNKSRSIERAGLDHLTFTKVYLDQEEEVREMLGHVRAVIASSTMTRKLAEFGASKDLGIIEEDGTLDKGGIEMLGRLLRQPIRLEED